MSSKLPYFKFDVTAWLTGSIQLLTAEEKGTFIDLCAMIWQENGELLVDKKLHRKLHVDDTTLYERIRAYTELDILVYENNILSVKFIDKQLKERKKVSEINKKNIEKRWNKTEVDTERNIREERRREKNKEKNTKKKVDAVASTSAISFSEMSERFEEFWKAYERKGVKKTAKAQWGLLKPEEWDLVIKSVSAYIAEQPEKKFRKDAERYLKHRVWEDVLERAEVDEVIDPERLREDGIPSMGVAPETMVALHSAWGVAQ